MIDITLKPEMSIEPGHQFLVVPNNPEGLALVGLLMPRGDAPQVHAGEFIYIPHNDSVDRHILNLIDQLAHARYQAPGLIQMTLQEIQE
jgi:hypothetical protein